jgi:hypothetical protein
VEYVSGLCAELVGTDGDYEEITFGDGVTANEKASTIASNLLLCQYYYISGGYKNIQKNGPLGTPLTSIIDRVDVDFNPRGFLEIVDMTTERGRDSFEPERDLERRTLQNSLFPGQDKLRQQTREFQRIGAGLKGMTRDQTNQFIEFLKGNFGGNTISTRFDPEFGDVPTGQLIRVGTPLFKPPVDNSTKPPSNTLATYPTDVDPSFDTIFIGVTSSHNQNANGVLYVVTDGETLCWVQGPIQENDPIGVNPEGYPNFASSNLAYLVNSTDNPVGIALQPVTDSNVKLIKVRLSAGAGGGGSTWLP